MREILFRGKRMERELGKPAPAVWLEGSLFYDPILKRAFILKPNKNAYIPGMGNMGAFVVYQVDPATVGQYTGLTDKNGKKIFEGDVVRLDVGEIGEVWYRDNGFAITSDECILCVSSRSEREVIGNIHDNPELLKGGAQNDG